MDLSINSITHSLYGISIMEFIRKTTDAEWSFAQIYDPLNKLTHKGYVKKNRAAPTPERGGRQKFLYEITTEGKAALLEIRRVHDRVWKNVVEKELT